MVLLYHDVGVEIGYCLIYGKMYLLKLMSELIMKILLLIMKVRNLILSVKMNMT